MKRGLGTQLRHLIDLLDGAVAAVYESEGLRYRPRFTPVMRALAHEPAFVTHIATLAGMTQPAATQTVALMIREGLLRAETNSEDSRQKMIWMTHHGRELGPRLEAVWTATSSAADALDADLPYPLSQLSDQAVKALAQEPFAARIHRSRSTGHNGRTTAEKGRWSVRYRAANAQDPLLGTEKRGCGKVGGDADSTGARTKTNRRGLLRATGPLRWDRSKAQVSSRRPSQARARLALG